MSSITTRLARSTGPAERERGSISVWMMSIATAMVLLLGLAVDASGQIHTRARVQGIAAEAARAGGQQLTGPAAIRGQDATIDPTAAVTAASAYLASASGVTGTATATTGERIVVTTHATYQTKFLSLIGITTLPASGHAEIEIHRVVQGAPR